MKTLDKFKFKYADVVTMSTLIGVSKKVFHYHMVIAFQLDVTKKNIELLILF